jgi:hypothetical protein
MDRETVNAPLLFANGGLLAGACKTRDKPGRNCTGSADGKKPCNALRPRFAALSYTLGLRLLPLSLYFSQFFVRNWRLSPGNPISSDIKKRASTRTA